MNAIFKYSPVLSVIVALSCSTTPDASPALPDEGTVTEPIVLVDPEAKAEPETFESAPAPETFESAPAPETFEVPLEDKLVPNAKTSFVDGRSWKKEAFEGAGSSVKSQVNFRYIDAPEPLHTRNVVLTVSTMNEPLSTPAVNIESEIHTLSLAGINSQTAVPEEMEAELMKNGISIVDRNHLEDIQSEFFLQGASAEPFTPSKLAEGEKFTASKLRTVGETPFNYHFSRLVPYWQIDNGTFYPLINGRNIDGNKRLKAGKIIPAQGMLATSPIHNDESTLSFSYQRPTAAEIPYIPAVIAFEGVSISDAGYWSQDPEDPFHLVYNDGATYYDPISGALWSITEAYLSRIVSREDYLSRRVGTKTTHSYCSVCSSVTDSVTEKYGRQHLRNPTEWACAECNSSYGVVYFDGYYDTRAAPPASEYTIIKWSWRELDSGIYPSLTPGSEPGIDHGAFYMSEATGQSMSIEEYASAENIMRTFHKDNWAFVNRGQAVIVSGENLDYLEKLFGAKVFPRTNSDGSLQYELSAEPYVNDVANVPVLAAALDARLIISEESRVALAGTLALSYRNLLAESFKFTCDSNGADLSKWPSLAQQKFELTAELIKRMVNYLK
jgi:hypothetical protein